MESYKTMDDGYIQRQSDFALIPPTEVNPDYVKYLADVIEKAEVLPFDYEAEAQRQIFDRASELQAIADKKAIQAAKAQSIIDNLPSWAQVDQAVTNISNLADAKAFIRKLARLVYWLARDQQD